MALNTLGIICEYNPFHTGHMHHINESRRATGLPVVCVMSGNFVQRGERALVSKFARAAMAVHCGADLVLELPVTRAMAGAQKFAEGAVSLLAAMGVTHISFGSECGNAALIRSAAEIHLGELAAESGRALV
jgi:predicted nucleotidyltransferase